MGKLLKILIGLVILVFIVLTGVLLTTDVNQYKPELIQLVKEKTGREFNIEGELKIVPSLIPTVAVEGVSFGNADWAKSKSPMLNVDKFEAQIALMPLLKKDIQVNRIILIKPRISLETNGKGNGNWLLSDSSEKETKASTSESFPSLNVQEVLIRDADVQYIDGKTGKESRLLVEKISMQSGSFDTPLALEVKASLNNAPIILSGTLGSVSKLLADEKFALDISGNIDDASLSAKGDIDKPLSAKGINLAVSFNINNLSNLNRITGSELPDAGPINITGLLKDVSGGYEINNMNATVMEHQVNGSASVSTSAKRPALKARLTADTLDLSAFSDTKTKEKKKKDKVFSKKALPLENMKAADIDLEFSAKKLITSSLVLDNAKLNMKLKNGVLNISNLSGDYAKGKLTANVIVDASNGQSAALKTDINLKQIELGEVPQLKEKNVFTGGKTDITIKANGKGKSVREIMSVLGGNLLVKTGSGKILDDSVDIPGVGVILSTLDMMNPLSKEEKQTSLECGVIKFNIKKGVATSDQGIALQTSKMNIMGSGVIDLKTEKLDLAVKPRARESLGVSLENLVDVVHIGGTLANPSPKVDASGALKAGLSAGAAVASGGLSLLAEGLFNKNNSDDANPCDVALGKVAKKSASKSKEKSASDDSAASKAVDTVKDTATEAIKGLKGLFD